MIVLVEAIVAAWLTLVAFVMSAWMVNDSDAFRMKDTDWVLAGCLRFLFWSSLAAAFGSVVAVTNRRLGFGQRSGWISRLPILLSGLVVVASGVGATIFVIEKPYM